jgi:hypothetical protein
MLLAVAISLYVIETRRIDGMKQIESGMEILSAAKRIHSQHEIG